LSAPAVAAAAWDGRKLPFGEFVKVSAIHAVGDKFSRKTLPSEPCEFMAKGSLENHLFSVHVKKSIAALQFVAWPLIRLRPHTFLQKCTSGAPPCQNFKETFCCFTLISCCIDMAPGASEEDMGISPGRFIAYSVARTR
ncbi:hypothetical protein ACJX0J_013087, partial [Zea mays]